MAVGMTSDAGGGRPGLRRPRKLVVPDVSGLLLRDAQIVLAQAGFRPAQPRYVEAYEAENAVVSQDPMRGLLVNSDAPIELRVAKPSWIRYLPQIYQVDGSEGELLPGLMWIFQHVHDTVRQKVDEMVRIFRPLEAPAEFLPWLASWIALHLEDDWDEEKKRRWLRYAPALYNIRGTKVALEKLLEIYVGVKPLILENEWPDEAFRAGVTSDIGITSTILPPMNLNNCFIVELPLSPDDVDEDQLIRIHRVIRAEKPAHCSYYLRFRKAAAADDLRPLMIIGVDAVGVWDD
jgi:phage tail-like protein